MNAILMDIILMNVIHMNVILLIVSHYLAFHSVECHYDGYPSGEWYFAEYSSEKNVILLDVFSCFFSYLSFIECCFESLSMEIVLTLSIISLRVILRLRYSAECHGNGRLSKFFNCQK
jgi:hypothetical protein